MTDLWRKVPPGRKITLIVRLIWLLLLAALIAFALGGPGPFG